MQTMSAMERVAENNLTKRKRETSMNEDTLTWLDNQYKQVTPQYNLY